MFLFENMFNSKRKDKNSQTSTHLTNLNSTKKNSEEEKIIKIENNIEKSNLNITKMNKNYIKNLQLNKKEEDNLAECCAPATNASLMEDCYIETKKDIVVCLPCKWKSSNNSIEEILAHAETAFHKMALKQRFEPNAYTSDDSVESFVNKDEVRQKVNHKKRQQGNEDVSFITDTSLLRNLEPVHGLNNLHQMDNTSEKVGSKRANSKNRRQKKSRNLPAKTLSKSFNNLNEIENSPNINIKESKTALKANSGVKKKLPLGQPKPERTFKMPNHTSRKDLSMSNLETDLLRNVKTSANFVFDKDVEEKIIFHNLQDKKVLKNLTSHSKNSNKKKKPNSYGNIVDKKPIQTQEDPKALAKKIMENQGLSSFVLEKVLADNNPTKAVLKTEARELRNLGIRQNQPSSSSTAQKQTPTDMSFISFTQDKAPKCEICQTTIPFGKDFSNLLKNVSDHVNGNKHIKKKRLLKDAISKAVDALN